MTSAAVFVLKLSERSINTAVSEPNAPCTPARRTTDANSSEACLHLSGLRTV
jgi:hypothetical protein